MKKSSRDLVSEAEAEIETIPVAEARVALGAEGGFAAWRAAGAPIEDVRDNREHATIESGAAR